MPTKSQIESALRNADAAGDVAAAKQLANALKAGQFDDAAPTKTSQQSVPVEQSSEPTSDPGLLQKSIDSLRGFRDIPQAGSQMLMHALPESVVAKGNEYIAKANELPVIGHITRAAGIVPQTTQEYDREIQQEEQAYQQRRKQSGETGIDGTRIAGNIAATAPIAAALPASPIVQGGVISALQPVTNGGDNFAQDKAIQTAVGAATGYAANKAVSGLSKAISPGKDWAVQLLDEWKVKLPIGARAGGAAKTAEAKLTSTPFLGSRIRRSYDESIDSFNRAAYQKVLEPIGKSAPEKVGNDGLRQVRQSIQAEYDDLLPNLKFIPDEQFNAEFAKLNQMVSRLPEKEAKRFQSVIDSQMGQASPIGGMTGETYKRLEETLLKEAKKFSGSTDAYQRDLGDAFSEALGIFKTTLERANPNYAERLTNINRSWANYAQLRAAAAYRGAKDGVFTPDQLLSAIRAGDKTVGKRAYGEGTALLQRFARAGEERIGKGYGDSGTAGRDLMWNPFAVGGGAILAPLYSAANRFSPMLLNRPAGAEQVSNALLRASPAISAGAAAMSNPLINNGRP